MRRKWLAILVVVGISPAARADATPPATAPSATVATTAPATRPAVALDQLTPRGAIKVLESGMLQGNAAFIEAVILTTTPAEHKIVVAFAKNNTAKMALRDAVQEKFPAPGTDVVALENQQMEELMGRVDAMDETIKGDDATVGMSEAGAQGQLQLKRVDGKWKIPFASMFAGLDGADPRIDELDVQSAVFTDLASGLREGKYHSMQEFEEAGRQKMMQAMLAKATTRPASTEPTTAQPATRP